MSSSVHLADCAQIVGPWWLFHLNCVSELFLLLKILQDAEIHHIVSLQSTAFFSLHYLKKKIAVKKGEIVSIEFSYTPRHSMHCRCPFLLTWYRIWSLQKGFHTLIVGCSIIKNNLSLCLWEFPVVCEHSELWKIAYFLAWFVVEHSTPFTPFPHCQIYLRGTKSLHKNTVDENVYC